MRFPLLLVVVVLLAGCTSPAVRAPLDASATVASKPSAFVALIDTGINPWHEQFRLPPGGHAPPASLNYVTVPATFRENLSREGLSAWNQLHKHQLYWFEGTRVLAISTQPAQPAPLELLFANDPHVIYDDYDHGTATASLVTRTCPDCWVVAVENFKLNYPAFDWVSHQQWIDVVSYSEGNIANTPNNFTTDLGPDAYAEAFHQVVRNGALVVAAVDNTPAPNLLGEGSPPWVIDVGGARGDEHGWEPISSQPIDVVADFHVTGMARNDSDNATVTADGTSFGTPIVAGALGEAIAQLRERAGMAGPMRDGVLVQGPGVRVTNVDLRAALNMSARYWNTTDWQTHADPTDPISVLDASVPAAPAVPGTPAGPWLHMGWGYVDANTTAGMVGLLTHAQPAPDKRDAQAFLEQVFALRQEAWALRQSL